MEGSSNPLLFKPSAILMLQRSDAGYADYRISNLFQYALKNKHMATVIIFAIITTLCMTFSTPEQDTKFTDINKN